jgi:Fe-S-cluster-containing dehydrogenase component
MHLQMKCDMCFDRTSEGLKPMCASVCPTGAISFGTYEQIVPLRRTKPVKSHVFGNQQVETKVYLMLPTESEEVEVDGCGVFEGKVAVDADEKDESWMDLQSEEANKANEF